MPLEPVERRGDHMVASRPPSTWIGTLGLTIATSDAAVAPCSVILLATLGTEMPIRFRSKRRSTTGQRQLGPNKCLVWSTMAGLVSK